MRSGHALVVFCVLGIGSSLCFGASATYLLQMDGGQQVPGPGDANGMATGTITLDDVTGLISWDFTYRNIDPPSAMHIHGPMGSAGQSAGVLIPLNAGTSGGPGTLINSLVHGTLLNVTAVLNNPTDFYVNIHNAPFAGGAVRGQLGAIGAAIYVVQMDGSQMVPGAGDPDGTASGTLSVDDDGSGQISWSFVYQDIDAPTAMHIHGPNAPVGQAAGVYIGLGVVTSGGLGTLIDSLIPPPILQRVTDVLDDPTDFYVAIHTGPFPGGAVRGQLGTGGLSGAVPDGGSIPGLPLLLGKGAGGTVDLDWVPSCLHTDTDYEIYEGVIGVFYSHGLIAPCTTGGLTFANIVPGAGSHYYLVVPTDTAIEGSYGTDSGGAERPPGGPACRGQSIGGPVCP